MTAKPVYNIILILLLTVLHKNLFAQTQNPRYNFKPLNVQTGLAQNIVYHFLQDSRGYMWMGTRNGLTLYDGTRTINFLNDDQNKKTIASNFITRIIEDPLQQIWIGTDGGISRYNRNDNSFSNFTVFTENGEMENSFCVPLGFVNDHEMWLLETKSKSIQSFNTKTQTTNTLATTTAVDATLWYDSLSGTHHVWTYLSSGSIHYIFKNKILVKKETFFGDENFKKNEPILQVVHVLLQNDSTTWLSTTAGLVELNPHNRHYTLYKNSGTQLVNELRYAAFAPNNMLWVATGNNGIYSFNLSAKKFIDNYQHYGLDQFSICSNNIVSIYFDQVGNVWCGSYGQGISYTNVENNYFQKSLSKNELEEWNGNNNVHWIGYDNAGNLWCILNNEPGFRKLSKNKHLLEYREPILENGKKFSGRFYKLLFDGDRYAWCVGKEGLFRYDLIKNRLRKMSYTVFSTDLFGSNWVQDIIRLNDQSFLFSTFSGLYRMTTTNGDYVIEPFSSINKNKFTSFVSLHQDEAGAIYVKDLADSLYVLKPSKNYHADPVVHSVQFLPQINQFYTDTADNSILLATNFGLYKLNRKKISLKKINLNPAVPFLSISSLVKADNKLWLFGEKGIFCFDEKKNTARTFTEEDGLPSNEFNISAIAFSQSECIAGTSNGLLSFFPDKLQNKSYPPLVQLTNVYVNDVLTDFIPNPQEATGISLRHQQNTFSFDFAPVAFQNAGQCSFEYKLDGYDEEWISSGNVRYTRYSNIPPGNYVFRLRAIDVNGNISPYNKTLAIKIAKAYWQTTLFKFAMAIIFLLLAWLVLKWYLQRKIRKHKSEFEKQQAVEKERTRIAIDMHDDLGAGLSTIRFLSEKVKRNSFSDVTKGDAEKIVTNSNDLVQKMNEIIWAMNEKNDTLEDLLYYTRSYTAEYCEENNLTCEIHLPKNIPSVFVSGEIRRNVFLTVKESLHNIVKHASAEKVIIDFDINSSLLVTVKDNGKGFSENGKNSGNGLRNMQKRMESVNGSFEIKENNGVLVIIKAPLPL